MRNVFVEINFVSGYSVSMLLGISYKFSFKFEISGMKRTRGPSHGLYIYNDVDARCNDHMCVNDVNARCNDRLCVNDVNARCNDRTCVIDVNFTM